MKKILLVVIVAMICLFTDKINAQEITVFPGFWNLEYYKDDKKISKKQLASILEKDNEAFDLWNKSNNLNTFTWVSLAVETGFGVWTLQKLQKNENGVGPAIATLISAASVVIFASKANKKRREAILKYNQSLDSKKITFKVEPSREGLGIVLRF